MFTKLEIYTEFRKAQAFEKNRGYRIPKDFQKHLKTKISTKNREALELCTNYFNTKWKHIDPFKYFEAGFGILKSFTYINFFDLRVIRLYIQRDKNQKRDIIVTKKIIVDSVKFIRRFIKDKGIESVSRYCMIKEGDISLPIKHYIKGYLSDCMIILLMKLKLLVLEDDEKGRIPYILQNYREISQKLDEMTGFIKRIKENII